MTPLSGAVSGAIFSKMPSIAEDFLGHAVTRTATMLAHFNAAQRKATKDAAAIAGRTIEPFERADRRACAYRLHSCFYSAR
jgi:hypothetical protein